MKIPPEAIADLRQLREKLHRAHLRPTIDGDTLVLPFRTKVPAENALDVLDLAGVEAVLVTEPKSVRRGNAKHRVLATPPRPVLDYLMRRIDLREMLDA